MKRGGERKREREREGCLRREEKGRVEVIQGRHFVLTWQEKRREEKRVRR